jgi:hypothetical protein
MAGNLLATILDLSTHRIPTSRMTKTTTDDQVTVLQWVTKPDDVETIDDAFWIKKQRWGTFVSIGADDLEIITSLTEERCISSTRWYLKAKQEGFTDDARTYDGVVGGKL